MNDRDGSAMPPRLVVFARRLCQAAAVVILTVVVVGYVTTLRVGRWPPSHPWSGLALVGLAILNLTGPANDPPRAPMRAITAALSITGALFWLWAVFLR